MHVMGSAAAHLEGLDLDGGWHVDESVPRRATATGGTFSESYYVSNDGKRAFLKALDFSGALRAPDPAVALQALTAAYLHERSLLEKCADERMSHVVLAIDHGEVEVDGFGPLSRVPYLILEAADSDARSYVEAMVELDVAWVLRSLHHIAVGMRQLHLRNIFHQDTKPSNVLVFGNGPRKLTDLGRATRHGYRAEHDDLAFAGDPTYAPPELHYGYLMPDERDRRIACDMFHLASMAAFFFTGAGITAGLAAEIDPSLHPIHYSGQYRDVLPHVREASNVVLEKVAVATPERYRDRLMAIVRELAEPDPHLRGDRVARLRGQSPYSLERFVSRLNLLARESELSVRRQLRA